MKFLATLFCCLCAALRLSATAQYPDRLIHNGQEYDLFTNPLDEYFKKYPEKDPRWPKPRDRYFKSTSVSASCSALCRDYIATFEIRDNQLFVKDVFVCDLDKIAAQFIARMENKNGKNDEEEENEENIEKEDWMSGFPQTNIVAKIFPDAAVIKADWFTGKLVIPQGKLVEYVHVGYASTYERYILIGIENGNVVNERNISRLGYIAWQWIEYGSKYVAEQEWADELRWKNLPRSSKWLLGIALFGVVLLIVLRVCRRYQD